MQKGLFQKKVNKNHVKKEQKKNKLRIEYDSKIFAFPQNFEHIKMHIKYSYCSFVKSCRTLCQTWTAANQAPVFSTIS